MNTDRKETDRATVPALHQHGPHNNPTRQTQKQLPGSIVEWDKLNIRVSPL